MAETEVLEQEQVETQAEETQEQQEEQGNNEFLDVLYNDLGVDIEPKPVEEPKAETEQAEPEPEPETPAPEPEPEPEKPKKKFEIKQPELSKEDIRRTIREELEQKRASQPPPPLPKEPEPEPVDELEDFLPEQRDEIELAVYAEKSDPKKYKGMAGKLKKFYSDLDEYIDNTDDPDRTFDEQDDEFIKWVQKNKPTISKVEQRKLERKMIKDQALDEARSEFENKNKELEEKIRQVEDRPKAANEYNRFEELLAEDKPEEEDQLATSVYANEMQDAKRVGKEYLDLFYGLKQYDEQVPLHTWIIDFVTQQSDAFKQHGGDHLYRTEQGVKKSFVPPSEFANADSSKHWTFTSTDIVDIMGNYFQGKAKDSIKTEEERLEKMGFKRQSQNKSQPSAKKEEAKAIETPKVTTSSSPGAANSEGVEEESSPGQDILDRLGIEL